MSPISTLKKNVYERIEDGEDLKENF